MADKTLIASPERGGARDDSEKTLEEELSESTVRMQTSWFPLHQIVLNASLHASLFAQCRVALK